MEPTQNGRPLQTMFSNTFSLPSVLSFNWSIFRENGRFGTVHCISYRGTHCHYNAQHV